MHGIRGVDPHREIPPLQFSGQTREHRGEHVRARALGLLVAFGFRHRGGLRSLIRRLL